MSDLPQISLNLLRKRRKKTQFRLRRRRFLIKYDEKSSPHFAEPIEQSDSPSGESSQIRVKNSDDEWNALKRAMEDRLKESERRAALAEETNKLLKREVDDLRESLKSSSDRFDVARKAVEDSKNQVARARAEMESQRKRITLERERLKELASENIIREILPIIDNFDIALKSCENLTNPEKVLQGFSMIQREMVSILVANGLERIKSEGQPFDPLVHDAASTGKESDKPDGIVLRELRPGYLLKTKVLRPSMVVVNKLHDTPVTDASEFVNKDTPPLGQSPAGVPSPKIKIEPGNPITPHKLHRISDKPVAPPPVRPQESPEGGSSQHHITGGEGRRTPLKDITDLSDTQF